MGNDDGAASVCDAATAASSSCQFLKCVVHKDKQPVYVEVSEACGFAAAVEDVADLEEEEMGRMSAKQDESGNWIVQWNVRRQKEGDFIGLCFMGKFCTWKTYCFSQAVHLVFFCFMLVS